MTFNYLLLLMYCQYRLLITGVLYLLREEVTPWKRKLLRTDSKTLPFEFTNDAVKEQRS